MSNNVVKPIKPTLIMLVGIPASGKSVYAEQLNTFNEWHIHSSDSLREEMFANRFDTEHNGELFTELYKRIKADLNNCINVIYDATNLSKKRRIAFLDYIGDICYKWCHVIAVPYELCLAQNYKRTYSVPDHVMARMYRNFEPPHWSEGWDNIKIVLNYDRERYKILEDTYSLGEMMESTRSFNQHNEHHTLTLYRHLLTTVVKLDEIEGTLNKFTGIYFPPNNISSNLYKAARYHDIGKLFTKSFVNHKHEIDGNAHFYQHHCVGAYVVMLGLMFENEATRKSVADIIEIINYIYYHMHPLTKWKQSEKAMEKDRQLLGDEMFNNICILSAADESAR